MNDLVAQSLSQILDIIKFNITDQQKEQISLELNNLFEDAVELGKLEGYWDNPY